MKDETWLYLAGLGAIGYFVYKLGKPVQDTGAGVATAVTGLGSGISEIGTSTGDAVSDVLSVTKPLKALSDWAVKDITTASNTKINALDIVAPIPMAIKALFNGGVSKAQPVTYQPYTPIYGKNFNPFINPTSQSFYTEEMAKAGYTEPALSIQNTVKLAKTSPTIAREITNKIATPTGKIITTSKTARYTGGIGKSSVTTKKK